MARPRTLTHEDFLTAALRIVDAEGLDELTFRRLGDEIGVSYTAVYTYFTSRKDLVEAIVGQIVVQAIGAIDVDAQTPRELIIETATAFRNGLAKHPHVIPAFLVATRDVPGSTDATGMIVVALERAGVSGDELALAYQAIESYIIGSTLFDFGAAPHHLELRRLRYEGFGHSGFRKAAQSTESVAANNEKAFVVGLEHLLVGFGIR